MPTVVLNCPCCAPSCICCCVTLDAGGKDCCANTFESDSSRVECDTGGGPGSCPGSPTNCSACNLCGSRFRTKSCTNVGHDVPVCSQFLDCTGVTCCCLGHAGCAGAAVVCGTFTGGCGTATGSAAFWSGAGADPCSTPPGGGC